MNRRLTLAGLASCSFTLIALLSGCGSSNHSTPASPGSPPSNPNPPAASFSVSSITPAPGTTGVALNSTIQITFSSPANASTVNTADIKVTDPSPVAGTVAYNSGNNTATFSPSAPLAANSTYTVTVSGVTSSTGAAMANPFTSTFATTATTTGGSGSSGNPTLQYQGSLLNSAATAVDGQVSVDTSGNVTVQLNGAADSTSYTVNFCPAFEPAMGTVNCFKVGVLLTGSNGSANSTYKFPQPGNWAGDFTLTTSASTSPAFSTYLVGSSTPPKGQVYMSTLEPDSTTNGTGALDNYGPQAPLTSGTVTYSSTTQKVTFTVNGGLPSTTYDTSETETTYMDGSGSYVLGNLTTDASGNGSASLPLDGIGGDLFEADPYSNGGTGVEKDTGYIGGFSIPK